MFQQYTHSDILGVRTLSTNQHTKNLTTKKSHHRRQTTSNHPVAAFEVSAQ